MKFGNINIQGVKFGSTQVKKVYSGTDVVWTNDTLAPVVGTLSSVVRNNIEVATLTWTAATDNIGISGYKIYRSSEGVDSGFTLLKTVGNVLTTTDTTITNFNDTYYYYITAGDAAENESSGSNHVSVAVVSSTDIFPSDTPISDNKTEGTNLTVFTPARFSVPYVDTVEEQVGTRCLRIESVGTDVQQYRDSFHPVVNGITYVVKFLAKASEVSKCQLNFGFSTTINIDSLTWISYEVTIKATATTNLRLYWYTLKPGATGNGTEKLWVDDFRIYELNDGVPLKISSGLYLGNDAGSGNLEETNTISGDWSGVGGTTTLTSSTENAGDGSSYSLECINTSGVSGHQEYIISGFGSGTFNITFDAKSETSAGANGFAQLNLASSNGASAGVIIASNIWFSRSISKADSGSDGIIKLEIVPSVGNTVGNRVFIDNISVNKI